MTSTRVKICGVTQPEDVAAAVAAGASAIGLVFYAKSPRAVTPAQAATLVSSLPPFVTRVGLFVDADPDYVRSVYASVPLDLLQYHGAESPEACRETGLPFIKAIQVTESTDIAAEVSKYEGARAVLLDTWHPRLKGGTGAIFDWRNIPTDLPLPLILAGGLNEQNVADAIRTVKPYAVDVSGGVERRRGVKSPDKITGFIKKVNATCANI